MRQVDKERAIAEVCGRVYTDFARGGDEAIEGALLDGFYHEMNRLKKEPPGPDHDRDAALWERVRETAQGWGREKAPVMESWRLLRPMVPRLMNQPPHGNPWTWPCRQIPGWALLFLE